MRVFSARRASPARQGYVTLTLIIVLPVLAVAFSLAINHSFVHDARTQLRNAADASALAAASALVDDRVLAERGEDDLADLEDLLRSVRSEACAYLERNPVPMGCGKVELRENPDNNCTGDYILGSLRHWKDKDFLVADFLAHKRCRLAGITAVQVTAERCRKRGNPVRLLPVPFQSACQADVAMRATAFLDGNIAGFRPMGSVPIPLVPIGILTGPHPNSWEGELAKKKDCWSFDSAAKCFHRHKGARSDEDGKDDRGDDENDSKDGKGKEGNDGEDAREVERTPRLLGDRICEVEVKLGRRNIESGAFNACLLQFGAEDVTQCAAQVQAGICAADLKKLGCDEIRLPGDGSGLSVPGCMIGPGADDHGENPLSLALKNLAATGEGRIWPLFSIDRVRGEFSIALRGFVAARVVEVKPASGDTSLRFTLQPCRLATGTALTFVPDENDPSPIPWNRYICKIRLTE